MDSVTRAVHRELGWIFRRTPQETDHGIDGYIDLVSKEGYVTGRSIAIQVKAGPSYFKQRTTRGWTYNGALRHANYYLNSPVNVILTIVDCDAEQCWWAHFDPTETIETSKGWGIEIPSEQKLDRSAKQLLEELAGDHVDFIPQLKAIWKDKAASGGAKPPTSREAVVIQVPRSAIESGDITSFALMFEFLASSPELLRERRGAVDFTISGYHDDKRELWEIPEVVSWLQKAAVNIDGLLYFLRMDANSQGIRLLIAASGGPKRTVAPKKIKGKRPGMIYLELEKTDGILALTNFLYAGLNRFTVENDVDELNEPVSRALQQYFLNLLGSKRGV